MPKWIRALTLALAITSVTAMTMPVADAQAPKKDEKKDEKKEPPKKEAKLGTFEVYKAKDGFRFRIKNAEEKTIAISTRAHETKEEVIADLDLIKDILTKTKVVEAK